MWMMASPATVVAKKVVDSVVTMDSVVDSAVVTTKVALVVAPRKAMASSRLTTQRVSMIHS